MRTDTRVWNLVVKPPGAPDVCCAEGRGARLRLRLDGMKMRRPRTGDPRYIGVVGRVRFMCEFLDWAAAVGR